MKSTIKVSKIKSLRDSIINLAVGQESGTTSRYCCPLCNGGEGRELSLSVSRLSEGLLYNCYRASCSLKGFVGTFTGPSPYVREPKKRSHKTFEGDLRELTKDEEEWLSSKFEIPPESLFHFGVQFCDEWRRFAYPIRGPHNEDLGITLRAYPEFDVLKTFNGTKAYSYTFQDSRELMAWYRTNHSISHEWCFVVEDQVSAMKIASLGYNSVALVGTTLNDNRINELRAEFQNVCIILDGDAFRKALGYIKKYWFFFNKIIGLYSGPHDPKDWPREYLRTKLKETVLEGTRDTGSPA